MALPQAPLLRAVAFNTGNATVPHVLTSGATADACARALKAAGVRCVFVLAAARTPLP